MRTAKMVLILLALVLPIAIVCAAGGSEQGKAAAPAATGMFKDPMEISVAFWGDERWGQDPKDTWLAEFSKNTNTTFKVVAITWGDWSDKLKMWAAGGTLPDMFVHDQPYSQWATQGLLKGFGKEYLDKYPNLTRYVPRSIYDALTIDGKIYSIPRGHWDAKKAKPLNLGGVYVRKDYMDKAGLTAAPDTLDGWYAFMKKAVQNDYSGTGTTYGIPTVNTLICQTPFVPTLGYWEKIDGKWMPSYFDKRTIDSITFARKLYQEGILYKDFAIVKEPRTMFLKGTAAVYADNADPDMIQNNYVVGEFGKDISKITDFIYLALPPKSPIDGKRYFPPTPNYWSYTGMNAKISDAKMDRILALLNYIGSDEGRMLGVYGVKGVDYTIDNSGQIVSLLPKDEQTGKQKVLLDTQPSSEMGRFFFTWDLEAAMNNPAHSVKIKQMSADFYASVRKSCTIVDPNWTLEFLSTPAKDKLPDLSQAYTDMYYVAVMSKDSVDKIFNDWVSEQMKVVGQAITEVNQKIK